MPADLPERRIRAERGGRQNAAGTLRRLLVTRQNDHRNPRPARQERERHDGDIGGRGRGQRRRGRPVHEKIGAGQESAGKEEGEADQGEEAHSEAIMKQCGVLRCLCCPAARFMFSLASTYSHKHSHTRARVQHSRDPHPH